jgi:signal transduction histidine kinase/CheY-like chemotaxis protein/ligand-binding sensor domain-containing protein
MFSKRSVLASLAILVCAFPLFADEWTPTRAFRTFNRTTSRGLPQGSVVALAQDVDGLLWLGTLDGAATFDGREIAPVASVPGSPVRGLITTLLARQRGGMYVGSPAGLHVFDGAAWRLVPSKKSVVSLAETTDGKLWMCDSDGALWSLRGRRTWEAHPEIAEKVGALAAAPDGALWLATDTNALRLDEGKLEPVAGAPLPGKPGALLIAHDGRAWIATLAGTVHWTRGDGWHQAPFAPWPRAAFRSMSEDRRGRIWATSFGGGVAFGNADMPWNVWHGEAGPFDGAVMSVLADREGSIWFGFNSIGFAQWVGEGWSHRNVIDYTAPRPINFAAFGMSRGAQPHSLAIAIFERGFLYFSDAGVQRFTAADGLTEDVRTVVEPEPGTFYAGTRFGFFEKKPGQPFQQVLKLSSFVMGFFKSPDGKWYAGTNSLGVFVRENGRWQPAEALNAQLEGTHVRNMRWRQNGDLWVATLRGVTVFRADGGVEHLTSKTNAAIPESVNAVLEVSGDEMWVGGTGGVAIRKGGKWRRMTDADGVPGQTVYSLARGPRGEIWAGGSGGVGRFEGGRWNVWDTREGMLNEECNLGGLIVDDDGVVYAGTLGGLARFDPRVAPLSAPPLKLTWRATPARDANGVAQVAARDRALHLRWSAPWLGAHPVQYRVRIPRLRDGWSAPMTEDHVDVENLGAGDWHVDVAARVEGTPTWTAPISLDVRVAPFWYETPLARAGMLLVLLAIIYLAVRLRVRALHRHAAKLEEIVRQRTAELAQTVDQLRDSEQRALAASRAKSAFLANMSHELRTPLNGILGFAQILSRRKDRDADDREGLNIIARSGEHLLGLINDVLSLSKIEAGRVTLEREVFELQALLNDVENVLRVRAEEKGLRLVCEMSGAQPAAVIGDQGKLRQILLNLVGNAVKFTEQGTVTVRASWQNGRARFDVDDTGPGIAASELPALFEPFVQTESGHRTKEGTGLGLALSRDLAQLMGGDIEVKSEPGRGSTFSVEVSMPEAAADAIVAAKERRRVASLAPGQQSIRVLVVDDAPLNRTVLSRLLAAVGFLVREAASGEEALATWQSWQPHFIWMDKRMPGIDGLEVTRRIRERERATGRARVPIIALSASALEHEREEILGAGCDDFVAKPFRESMIFARMREHLGVEYVYESEAPVPKRVTREEKITLPSNGAVLVVDDDWVCRQVAQEILRGHGVAVTTVASGREALNALDASKFDLVLMDVQMPDMDGVETMRQIRTRPALARLPIIAMTAEDKTESASGMDDYIVKPVEPAAVSAVLGRWMP